MSAVSSIRVIIPSGKSAAAIDAARMLNGRRRFRWRPSEKALIRASPAQAKYKHTRQLEVGYRRSRSWERLSDHQQPKDGSIEEGAAGWPDGVAVLRPRTAVRRPR